MPPVLVPVPAKRLDLDAILPDTIGGKIAGDGYKPLLRDRFLGLWLNEPFDPDRAKSVLRETILDSQSEALELAIAEDAMDLRRGWGSKRDGLLVNWPDLPADRGDGVRFPNPFLSALDAQLQEHLKAVDLVVEVMSNPSAREFRRFVTEVYPLVQEMEASHNLSPVYQHIKRCALEPTPIVSPSDPRVLYLLTFLPYGLRYSIQDLLVSRLNIQFIDKELDASDDEVTTRFLTLLRRRCEAGIFHNSHWERLRQWNSLALQETLEFAQLSSQEAEICQAIFDMAGNKAVKAAYKKFGRFQDGRQSILRKLSDKFSPFFWQETDIGHCFQDHDFALGDALARKADQGVGTGRKNGQFAVVLEDDPAQMRMWADKLTRFSPYTLLGNGDGLCTRPDEVRAFFGRKDVGLFLLDIENFGDSSKTVQLAVDLLTDLGCDRSSKQKKVVILWTASGELWRKVLGQMRAILDRTKLGNSINFEGSESGKYVYLKVEVKGGHPWGGV